MTRERGVVVQKWSTGVILLTIFVLILRSSDCYVFGMPFNMFFIKNYHCIVD